METTENGNGKSRNKKTLKISSNIDDVKRYEQCANIPAHLNENGIGS